MGKREQIWSGLESPEYRKEYVAEHIKTGLAFQIRLLREGRGWTQNELANKIGKAQETISQWENPDYGSYTLSTLRQLAEAFDTALLVRFVPFSELVSLTANLTPEKLAPDSFQDDRLPEPSIVVFAGSNTAQTDPDENRERVSAAGVDNRGDYLSDILNLGVPNYAAT